MDEDVSVSPSQVCCDLEFAGCDSVPVSRFTNDDHTTAEQLWFSYIEAQETFLEKIDRTSDDTQTKTKHKLDLMENYVSQLKEQNDVLLKTAMELEREARMRVTQMETRLKTSAKATKEVVLKLYEYERMFSSISQEKLDLEAELQESVHQESRLKVENSFLRDQNGNLKHDLYALLQVIQQARSTGQWLMDCVTFCELTPDEVFGPVCSYSRSTHVEDSLMFSHSERSSSCNSSYSNLVEAEQGLAKKSDLDLTLKELHQQIRHLQKLREQAQLEFLERDRSIAELETQITSLNYQVDILRTECERYRLVIGEDGITSSFLLALPPPPQEKESLKFNHLSTQTEEKSNLKDSDFFQEIRKWEEKVEAKEMLIKQLQNHLQTSFTEVELKDTALHNAEQKLTCSRLECAQLREDKSQLQQELAEATTLCTSFQQNVISREQELQDCKADRQNWNGHKQNLMIMCDEQSEKIFQNEEDIALLKAQIRVHTAEICLQKVTIQNLQEALVRSTKDSSEVSSLDLRSLSPNAIQNI